MIGIISDIHGNHVALSAVLARLDEMGVSEIVCLGDVGGYYCQVNECCDALQSRNIFSLMGNHDWYLASGESCPRSNSANRCLDYQRQVLGEANRNWLASLKPMAKIGALSMVLAAGTILWMNMWCHRPDIFLGSMARCSLRAIRTCPVCGRAAARNTAILARWASREMATQGPLSRSGKATTSLCIASGIITGWCRWP